MTARTDKRWIALYVLCCGALMMVLDASIVNVALPSIKTDLGFTDSGLAWVVNAFTITFAGMLLLGGRLGDLYGQRRWFLIGIGIFTCASLACGLATSQTILITARAIQGIGGAIANAIALSLVLRIFPKPSERARAMGIFGFVAAGGGSVGVFLGGILTGALNWHWIFLINIPIGVLVTIASMMLLSADPTTRASHRLDIFGAITVTASLMLAVYAIVNGASSSAGTMIGLLIGAALLFACFILIESKVSFPLVPFSVFRTGSIALVSMIGILWSAAMFSWFFLSALYLQLILGYSPLQVGLSFLPANLIMAAFSIGLSARLVGRFGTRRNIIVGMAFITLGLALFAVAPLHGTFVVSVLPAMLLLGLGAGTAFNPVLLAGTADANEEDSGLISGVLNTAFMMGGSLGLAVLASIAAYRTSTLATSDHLMALLSGYHTAFVVGAIFAFGAWLCALRVRNTRTVH